MRLPTQLRRLGCASVHRAVHAIFSGPLRVVSVQRPRSHASSARHREPLHSLLQSSPLDLSTRLRWWFSNREHTARRSPPAGMHRVILQRSRAPHSPCWRSIYVYVRTYDLQDRRALRPWYKIRHSLSSPNPLRCLRGDVRNNNDVAVTVTHHRFLQRLLDVRGSRSVVEAHSLGLRIRDAVEHLRPTDADDLAA